MGTSSLLGIDRAPITAPGRDSALLGPSDTSDSGSDVAGLSLPDDGGPSIDSDSTGTGERRSAASDAGDLEAADISPDRIVSDPNGSDLRDDPDAPDDPNAGLVESGDEREARDALLAASSLDEDDEEEEEVEDEDADPVGDPNEVRARRLNDEGDDRP